MDQLTAHLDRGWDLVQRGDARGAGSSARRAIELEPESPEAFNLLGYVAALDGDVDEALEAYEQAIMLDETYVEAMLNAAELYLHPLGEWDEVIALCERVLTVTDYADEVLDTRLLQFEALVGMGQLDDAKSLLTALPAGPYEQPSQCFLVGRACYEVGELERAAELLEAAVELAPDHADALYYNALVREDLGDRRGATESFLRSRELELAGGLPPWAPTGEALRLLTENALADLSPEHRRHLAGADVFISGVPGAEVVVDGVDPRSLALIDALPAESLPAGSAKAEVRVFIYALNVVKAAGGLHALQHQIRLALEREIEAAFMEPAGPADATPATD